MPGFEFERLLESLRDEYGSDLRWVANYNSKTYRYKIRHVREDLRNDLTDNQLDYIIHRSLAVFNKRHTEEIYFHLGESNYLVANYERGTAYHLFLDDIRGVTIMLESDVSVTIPDAITHWRDSIDES